MYSMFGAAGEVMLAVLDAPLLVKVMEVLSEGSMMILISSLAVNGLDHFSSVYTDVPVRVFRNAIRLSFWVWFRLRR